MEGLGRSFNVVPTAADTTYINMAYASGVTFVCVGADTYTVQSSATASGGADLVVIDHYYTLSAADGSVTWVRNPVNPMSDAAPTASRVIAANGAIWVGADSLPDGHKYVKCVSTSTGLVIAITHDLYVQRKPSNLPALGV